MLIRSIVLMMLLMGVAQAQVTSNRLVTPVGSSLGDVTVFGVTLSYPDSSTSIPGPLIRTGTVPDLSWSSATVRNDPVRPERGAMRSPDSIGTTITSDVYSGPQSPIERKLSGKSSRADAKFNAKFYVLNSSTKMVTALEWELVTRDPATGHEHKRVPFRNEKKIKPGGQLVLPHKFTFKSDWQRVKDNQRTGQSLVQALLTRVEYADGSSIVWNKSEQ